MDRDALRQALTELNGERNALFTFENAKECNVPNAILIPNEADNLVKVSDGKHVYIIDAPRVAWIKIG